MAADFFSVASPSPANMVHCSLSTREYIQFSQTSQSTKRRRVANPRRHREGEGEGDRHSRPPRGRRNRRRRDTRRSCASPSCARLVYPEVPRAAADGREGGHSPDSWRRRRTTCSPTGLPGRPLVEDPFDQRPRTGQRRDQTPTEVVGIFLQRGIRKGCATALTLDHAYAHPQAAQGVVHPKLVGEAREIGAMHSNRVRRLPVRRSYQNGARRRPHLGPRPRRRKRHGVYRRRRRQPRRTDQVLPGNDAARRALSSPRSSACAAHAVGIRSSVAAYRPSMGPRSNSPSIPAGW
jgi:hypothetical protein